MTTPQPLLVVGSPRSGTTLIGAVLGTADRTMDLGEYVGYDFCHRLACQELTDMPGPATREYLQQLQDHAHTFPRTFATGYDWFVTSAPWNLLVAEKIRSLEPSALFVLCFRRVEGVCQSLKRSYNSGRLWAGENTEQRINLWCQFYGNTKSLPADRTVLVDYERLCKDPEVVWQSLAAELSQLGFPAQSCDPMAFARSHATTEKRSTIAQVRKANNLVWTPRPSWDPMSWSRDDQISLERHELLHSLSGELKRILNRFSS